MARTGEKRIPDPEMVNLMCLLARQLLADYLGITKHEFWLINEASYAFQTCFALEAMYEPDSSVSLVAL